MKRNTMPNSKSQLNYRLLMGFPFILGLAISLMSPLDVLNFEPFNLIYQIGSALIPSVSKMRGDYELGQIAKLYFSSMWLMTPLIFIGAYKSLLMQESIVVPNMQKNRILALFFFFLFSPAVVLLAFGVTFESSDTDDFRAFLTFHSRFGMPFLGFIIPAGASSLLAMTFFGFKNLKHIFNGNGS